MSTTTNTAYNVRTDVVETETGLTIEEGALYTYDGELKAHLGGSTVVVKPKTEVVNISSAQILAMGTTPIVLLPVLPALSYYDIESILLEYTFDSTNYTIAEPLYAYFGNAEYFTISERIINGNASVLKARVAGVIDQDLVATGTGAFINMDIDVNVGGDTSLLLTTWNNTDPTLGDGTLRAIITYTVRTFGA